MYDAAPGVAYAPAPRTGAQRKESPMAHDDDDELIEEIEELEEEVEDDADVEDIDVEDLDEEEIEGELEADEFGDEETFAEEEEDEDEPAAGPVRRSVGEDEDEDEDLLTPDDVEADLDTILKDRLEAPDEDDQEEDEPEERGENADRLQPKRADEQLCSSCFLLVRQGAPMCPVGDDDCPLFS